MGTATQVLNAQSTRHGARPGPTLAPWCTGGAPCVPRSREREKRPTARREKLCIPEKKTILYILRSINSSMFRLHAGIQSATSQTHTQKKHLRRHCLRLVRPSPSLVYSTRSSIHLLDIDPTFPRAGDTQHNLFGVHSGISTVFLEQGR